MSEKKEEKRPEDLFILEGISYVSFNKDFSQVALSKKNKKIYLRINFRNREIIIYKKEVILWITIKK